jgi:hypothetical protein
MMTDDNANHGVETIGQGMGWRVQTYGILGFLFLLSSTQLWR